MQNTPKSPCWVTSILPPMQVRVIVSDGLKLVRRFLFLKVDAEAQWSERTRSSHICSTVFVDCTHTASNDSSSSSSTSAGIAVVKATDFFAFSCFSSAIALLSVQHSNSVCPGLSQYSHLGLALFFTLTASCCSLVILSHSSLGMVFLLSLLFLFWGSLPVSLA